MFYWCTLVLLTLVPVVTGDHAGVTVKLTKKGLDLVADKAIEKLKQYIQDMDIPDQTIPIPLKPSVIGMKIRINELKSVQALVPTTGVDLTIKSAEIQVTGNLVKGTIKLPFNVNVDKLAISVTVAVKVDGTGHLTLNIEKCKTEIGRFRVETLSSLFDILSWLNSYFPSFLDKRVCSKITTLADFNPQLATLNDKVRELSGINLSMEPTVITKDSIELSFVSLEGRQKRRLLEETKDSPEN
ncbi:unnamed protein product [Leuciscus chuanchicus]